MPNLVYTVSPYVPFTKILSANINQDKTDIQNRINWSGTAADAATGLDSTNIQGVTAIAVVNASVITQGVTLTALAGYGANGNSITITFTSGAVAGSEVVSVIGTAITVQVSSGVSTVTQVVTAMQLPGSVSRSLVTASGSAGTTVVTAGAVTLSGGVSSGGLVRSTKFQLGAANGFVMNDSTGAMQTFASGPNQTNFTNSSGAASVGLLPLLSGGTGASVTLIGNNVGDNLQVLAGGATVGFASPSAPSASKVFNFFQYT